MESMMQSIMKSAVVACAVLVALPLAARPAAAEISAEEARAIVAPFYDGLTAAPGKDTASLLRQATSPDWVSCGANDVCGAREQVIAAIAARQKDVPDLKWVIREVLVSGNRIIVRGEA